MTKQEQLEALQQEEYHLNFKMKTALRNDCFIDAQKWEVMLSDVKQKILELENKES